MSRPQILVCIVDDDASLRRGLGRLMQAYGYQTRVFASAKEYLESYETLDVGCLVLDVNLGGMSGFELLEELRNRGVMTPTILITAYDEDSLEQRAKRSGSIGYLRKPFDDTLILETIGRAVGPWSEDKPL